MHFTTFALAAVALVTPSARSAPTIPITSTLTEKMLLSIAPTSNSCAGAGFPAECRTAAQALKPIKDSFVRYEIGNPLVQAAIVSLIAYETDDFKYNLKHYPSVMPGYGTRNMQKAAYNAVYAKSLGLTMKQLFASDAASFGSAAWYVTTNCPFSTRQKMWTGSDAAWGQYVTECVGAAMDAKRTSYWKKAKASLTGH